MARINYEIPEPIHQALREQSAQENRSQKAIIIEALEEKLDVNDPEEDSTNNGL